MEIDLFKLSHLINKYCVIIENNSIMQDVLDIFNKKYDIIPGSIAGFIANEYYRIHVSKKNNDLNELFLHLNIKN